MFLCPGKGTNFLGLLVGLRLVAFLAKSLRVKIFLLLGAGVTEEGLLILVCEYGGETTPDTAPETDV